MSGIEVSGCEYEILSLMALVGGRDNWYFTYFRIVSLSSPTVSIQYPFAQK